jgi:hypothetical protein
LMMMAALRELVLFPILPLFLLLFCPVFAFFLKENLVTT